MLSLAIIGIRLEQRCGFGAILSELITNWNIYANKGRGTVAIGRVEQGTVKVGDDVVILGLTQVIAKLGTVKTYKRFEVKIYVLTKEESGRHTAFFSNYRPQFYMRTIDITGKVELPENVKMVMPGDNVTAVFELISPVPLEACIAIMLV